MEVPKFISVKVKLFLFFGTHMWENLHEVHDSRTKLVLRHGWNANFSKAWMC